MTKEIEKIIARIKKEVGKSKQMTAREMKLIEICIDELVVKNCNIPLVSNSVCDYCGKTLMPYLVCLDCNELFSTYKQTDC